MPILDKYDPRVALEQLIRERGEDYASLSRLIGRNSAYIQQFIKRGVPRKLDEEDRRTLADYFGVKQQLLGGPAEDTPQAIAVTTSSAASRRGSDLVQVPYINAQASAGPGSVVLDERVNARLAFRSDWLRELSGGSSAGLSVIRVKGDSMIPTLSDGDDILVDRNDGAERLRDGIYVLRADDMLNVKRIATHPAGKGFEIRSDNPAYPVWRDCDMDMVTIIGRVIWAGRRIS